MDDIEQEHAPARASDFCVIIPAFREQGRIGNVVRAVHSYCRDVVVVDDGSPDSTADEARQAGAIVVRHPTNLGKGVALNTGFTYAREHGYEFLITLDGDGQHDPEDLPAFVEAYRQTGTPVLIGNRMDDPRTMPFTRRITNQYMSWLLSRHMGQRVPDTQSGYRLFRCDVLASLSVESSRFAAESEILLILSARGVKIGAVPIKIIYRDEKSKIRPVHDTFRFYAMLRRYKRPKTRD